MSTRPHPRPSCETAAQLLAGRRGAGATPNHDGGRPMGPDTIRHRELLDHLRTITPAEAAAEMLSLEQERDRLRSVIDAVLPADSITPAPGAEAPR
ncbi:hypothetical protein [Pseudoroseomonas cervicalis]|uniref:hypothetical protein n=1 Tax=Teichococcus cervicalis TaxID=204525 RepID=UPI00277E3297|nr:hypothetical protein [Pseudoroseomonas cervicalis]MDQ1079719.1 hypothetical protein [Pseudoroseomonas cervicalis]